MLLLQRLHPGNILLALAWSCFQPVRYWRTEYLPKHWLKRFQPVDPAELFEFDEWQQITENAFDEWSEITRTSPLLFSVNLAVCGQKIDFTQYWIQWLALRFEERVMFLEMVRREVARSNAKGSSLGGSLLSGFEELNKYLVGKQIDVKSARIFSLLDGLWIGLFSLIKSVKQVIALFKKSNGLQPGTCSVIWTGISLVEVPEADQKLTFYFLIERGLLDPSSCLFVLPSQPSPDAVRRLEKYRVRWTTVSSFGFLSLRSKLVATVEVAINAMRASLFCLFGTKYAVNSVAAIDAIPWTYVAKELGIRTYVNSVSNCWPEPSEVCALGAFGVRTINWSYGANTYWYSARLTALRDVAVARSSARSDEIWIWSSSVEKLLLRRSLHDQTGRFRVIGEVMCGDSKWIRRAPNEARNALGINNQDFPGIVSIFDVPPVTAAMRLSIGQGPTIYPVEVLDRFFSDLEKLLWNVKDIRLLIKPKRSLSDPMREYSPAMREILDPESDLSRAGRILPVPHDIDPYLPVAVADVCIGVPFTSPVMAAINSGRVGVFYDPLRRAIYAPNAPHLSKYLCHDIDDLEQRVIQGIGSYVPKLDTPELGERFAGLLRA